MTLNEYQGHALKTAIYPRTPLGILYPFLGLASEAGEVAGKMSKIVRGDFIGATDTMNKAHTGLIKKELGDCLWMIAACAAELGATLEEIDAGNVKKLQDRTDAGTLQGDGDER